jgi:hypothetical protein
MTLHHTNKGHWTHYWMSEVIHLIYTIWEYYHHFWSLVVVDLISENLWHHPHLKGAEVIDLFTDDQRSLTLSQSFKYHHSYLKGRDNNDLTADDLRSFTSFLNIGSHSLNWDNWDIWLHFRRSGGFDLCSDVNNLTSVDQRSLTSSQFFNGF